MTSHHFERTVRQSVLDRLIDDDERHPAPRSWDESVFAFRESVMRDLQWLLNTRRVHPQAPAALDLVRGSIYAFGIRDLSSRGADSLAVRSDLQREIETAIATFEPRLAKVHVTMVPPSAGTSGIRFHVEGELRTDPAPETVRFESTLDVSSKAVVVTGSTDA